MQNKNIKTVAFYTLGCKVNQYETNAMMQKLKEAGYEIVNFEQKADIYIINTCTVTNMADKKSRQMLRRVKEVSPNSILVAVGCYAQVAKQELEKIPEIDLILGINEKNDIVSYMENAIESKKINTTNQLFIKENRVLQVSDVANQKEFLDFGNVTYTEKTRAVIKVQDGCNQFCSYCIIPYARGRIRSRNPQSVIKEITAISNQGIKEVVITGIHLASYGKDFER
jgi:threonylcarbamoyladenosine tRNA methylthiotransferase MtaB